MLMILSCHDWVSWIVFVFVAWGSHGKTFHDDYYNSSNTHNNYFPLRKWRAYYHLNISYTHRYTYIFICIHKKYKCIHGSVKRTASVKTKINNTVGPSLYYYFSFFRFFTIYCHTIHWPNFLMLLSL